MGGGGGGSNEDGWGGVMKMDGGEGVMKMDGGGEGVMKMDGGLLVGFSPVAASCHPVASSPQRSVSAVSQIHHGASVQNLSTQLPCP